MFGDDNERPAKPADYTIGMLHDDFSVEDFDKAIEILENEIVRLKENRRGKAEALGAADALFQKR